MNSLLKKYKYFILSSVLHISLLILVFYSFSNEFTSNDINFNTKGSKGVELVSVSVLQEKGSIKKPDTKKGIRGESTDETNVQSVIQDQSLLQYKAPIYPRVALLNQQQGSVIVRLLVEPSGDIKKIIIHKSSGFPLLDNSVLEVARYWNIKRSLKETSWIQVNVDFVIQ